MSYIIISNIGMAVMMLLIYLKSAHVRLKSKKDIELLKKGYEFQINELKKADSASDLKALKAEAQKVNALELQIKELERDRDSEIKLRINAEKQIDVANKKMQELEKRIEDWSIVQDAIMSDNREAIIKIGNDLFKKLNDSYKQEVETNRNLIGRILKNSEEQKAIIAKIGVNNSANDNSRNSTNSRINNALENGNYSKISKPEINYDYNVKLLLDEIQETMKAAGKLANKDYFTALNFDEQRAKLLLCELVFVNNGYLYIIDFKAVRYFSEYEKMLAVNKIEAENFLKEKLEKYLAYLSNPKYLEAISKALISLKINNEKQVIILALPSKKQMSIIKDSQYFEMAKKLNISIMDFDLIVNIII